MEEEELTTIQVSKKLRDKLENFKRRFRLKRYEQVIEKGLEEIDD